VYQLTIEGTGGDSYVVTNYLLVRLSSSAKTWLLGLPTGSIRSWNHLCRMFISNLCAMCAHPGVDWDLASVIQKKGESLRKFIQRFCNKRNIIPKVDNKSIVMFFKEGLRDPSFIYNLTMKTPRMSETMFAIANKYALAEEVTLDIREQKEEWRHTDQPSSFKGHDKKRKADHSVNAEERPRHNKEYWPELGEFEGFLDRICIFHPHGKHKTRECD
jgi:hypothetical protein